MNEWVLILTVMMGNDFASSPRAVAIEVAPITFPSEEACLAAGQKWGMVNKTRAPSGTQMSAVCVKRGTAK